VRCKGFCTMIANYNRPSSMTALREIIQALFRRFRRG
jgi:hypothetical protein